MDNSLMQKRSNVQDNIDITEQSFSSIPSIKTVGPFWKNFCEAIGCLPLCTFNFFTLFLSSEKNSAYVTF